MLQGAGGNRAGASGPPWRHLRDPRAERPLPPPKIHRFGSAEEKSWKKGLERGWTPRGPSAIAPKGRVFCRKATGKSNRNLEEAGDGEGTQSPIGEKSLIGARKVLLWGENVNGGDLNGRG